jgi:hypothetical protein
MKNITVEGKVKITHFDKNRKIISIEEEKNLIVNAGLEYVSKLVNGVSTNPFKYIALGTGTDIPESGDTGLTTETVATGLERALTTCEYVASYKAHIYHTFTNTSGGTVGLNEAGIFDTAVTGGNMLAHRKFDIVKNVADDESILVEWTITISTT